MKNVFIKPILLISFVVIFFASFRSSSSIQFIVENVGSSQLEKYKTNILPVTNAKQALGYVLSNEKILPSLKEVEESRSGDNMSVNWSLSSKKQDGNWQVRIGSRGFLPSYSCIFEVDEQGGINTIKPCQYNK